MGNSRAGSPGQEATSVALTTLASWLEERKGRPIACLGVPPPALEFDDGLTVKLRLELNQVRRQKDDVELSRMRRAIRATGLGFAAVQALLAPGTTEREVQIELEAEFFRSGADFLAYETIVAGGPNAAVLHATPTARPLRHGELVLIDAGAEYRGYAADITRTYPVSRSFRREQAVLHSVVESAATAAMRRCTAGTEFSEVNQSAVLAIAEGLIDFGLLRGQPDSLAERGTISIFFPHAVGHMVGLGVRDAGEVLPGRERAKDAFPRLTVDLPLLTGHVVTIEPGIYFVPALLGDAELRRRHWEAVDWDLADRMIDFGGIRIEDDVLVTENGFENLSAGIPLLG